MPLNSPGQTQSENKVRKRMDNEWKRIRRGDQISISIPWIRKWIVTPKQVALVDSLPGVSMATRFRWSDTFLV